MSSEVREKILTAGAHLFALQGYSGTGVRELAREAGVALSMVNYHFGTKAGVVCELLDRYFTDVHETLGAALQQAESFEATVHAYVLAMVTVARRQPNACRLAISEWSMETPDIAEYKAKKLTAFRDTFAIGRVLAAFDTTDLQSPMVGPAVAYGTLSHFVVGPLLARADGLRPQLDDAYYTQYVDQLTRFVIGGLRAFMPS